MEYYTDGKGQSPSDNQILAVDSHEAARMLGVCERHIRNMANKGKVPSVRLGRRMVFPIAGLKSLLTPPTNQAEG